MATIVNPLMFSTPSDSEVYFNEGVKHYNDPNQLYAYQRFQKASKLGNFKADYYLGMGYLTGCELFKKDEGQAFEYFRVVHNFYKDKSPGIYEYNQATYQLALCYKNSIGVEKDPLMAFELLKLIPNCPEALFKLGLYCGQEHESPIPKSNLKEIYEYFNKAAEMGHPEALFKLGIWNLDGCHVKRDEKIAYEYFRRAAERGHPEAQYKLGIHNREAAQQNIQVVQKTQSKMKQGESSSALVIEEHNKKASELFKAAFEWFKKAAAQGHALAGYEVGKCYEYGLGVGLDLEAALNAYIKSSQEKTDAYNPSEGTYKTIIRRLVQAEAELTQIKEKDADSSLHNEESKERPRKSRKM